MLKLFRATVSLLLIVTVRVALGVPTASVVLNAIEAGETVTGAMGVPVKLTTTVPALSPMVIVPATWVLAASAVAGVNVALMVHVAPAANPVLVPKQLSVSPNCELGVMVRS
jgi:hypothetical protein